MPFLSVLSSDVCLIPRHRQQPFIVCHSIMASRTSTSASSDPSKGRKGRHKSGGSDHPSKTSRKEASSSKTSKAVSSDEQRCHKALDKLYEKAAN